MPEGKVVRVRKIQTPNVTISTETNITNFNRVRSNVSDQSRPHQKTISIELNAASIIIEMEAALNRVTFGKEILPKNICYVNVLMASVEAIETAIGVLFEHRKISGVVLHAIIIKRTENPRPKVVVGKDKAAKVRHEWLNPRPQRHEVIVCIHVRKFHLTESLFE